MVTLKSSNIYTKYSVNSFFKNTTISNDDEFLLIDNDGCKLDAFYANSKIKIMKNKLPLSFAKNVNLAMKKAKESKKNLIFLNNDIIFTSDWFEPLDSDSQNISIPVNNQIFPYQSDCKNLKLKITMDLKDFDENYTLLNEIVKKHKQIFKIPNKRNESSTSKHSFKIQTLLMPFFCFKIPNKIIHEIGYFDETFLNGAEDVDYRIRCAQKNFDVNFLLNSYLLHFHGKSTWHGAETRDQTEKRNELYTKVFLKKWGKEMTQIFIIRKNFYNILLEKNLIEFFEKKIFGELIRKLLL